MSATLALKWAFLAFGLIVSTVSIPLLFGLVPRNPFYGFRTRRTLHSDELWYPVNRVAGGMLLIAGLVQTSVATGLFFLEGSATMVALILLVTVAITVAAAVIFSCLYLENLIGSRRPEYEPAESEEEV